MCVALILSYYITKYNVTVTHRAASRFLIAKRLFFLSASANSDRGMLHEHSYTCDEHIGSGANKHNTHNSVGSTQRSKNTLKKPNSLYKYKQTSSFFCKSGN